MLISFITPIFNVGMKPKGSKRIQAIKMKKSARKPTMEEEASPK